MSINVNITDNNFNEVIKENEVVVIDFWATWCGPCRALSPFIEKLSDTYEDKALFCKANIEEASNTAEKLAIQSVPCVTVFKNGLETNRIVGFNQVGIKNMIESL
jgi:thioredoxin 1